MGGNTHTPDLDVGSGNFGGGWQSKGAGSLSPEISAGGG